MKNEIKQMLKESIQGLVDSGIKTTFTEVEFKKLGIKIPKELFESASYLVGKQ